MTQHKASRTLRARVSTWSIDAGWLPMITAAIGFASFLIGFVGWCFVPPPKEVSGPLASIAYDFAAAVQSFVPNPDRFKEGNAVTQFAAAVGMLAAISAGLLTAGTLLAGALRRFWVRRFVSNHVIILGDTALADITATLLTPTHFVVHEIGDRTGQDSDSRISHRLDVDSILSQLRVAHAEAILVDMGADSQTLNLTASLHKRLPSFSQTPRLAFCVNKSILAEQFFDQWLATSPHDSLRDRPALLDVSDLLARKVISQHPLFAQADSLLQNRVHAVIVGFGTLGEALLEQVFLTGIAAKLGEPKVSIFDADPLAKARFDARRPHVSNSLTINFECFDTKMNGFDPQIGMARLCEIASSDPVTAFFIALPSDELNLETALQLRRLFQRCPKLTAPIFYRCRAVQATGFFGAADTIQAWPWVSDTPVSPCVMAIDATDIKYALRPDSDHDTLAQNLHLAYSQKLSDQSEATHPWPRLRETYRRANIRAAWHVGAKLYSLGVKVTTLRKAPQGTLPILTDKDQAMVGLARSQSEAVLNLAKIEHARWMVDRKLDGWRYGAIRDNANQIHPLLIGWDELEKKPEEVEKDIIVVLESLDAALKAR